MRGIASRMLLQDQRPGAEGLLQQGVAGQVAGRAGQQHAEADERQRRAAPPPAAAYMRPELRQAATERDRDRQHQERA